MTDNDSKATGGNGDSEGGDKPLTPGKEPDPVYDIHADVNQKLDGIFGDLDDNDEDDDPEATAGVIIEIVRGKPAPDPVTDSAPDTLSPDADIPDLPVPENEIPPAAQTGSGQIAHPADETVTDSSPEETAENAAGDETPPREKEPEAVSDPREEANLAIDNDSGDPDSDDGGDVPAMVADMATPAITAADSAPDTPDPLVPPTEAVTPVSQPANGDKPEEDAVVSLSPETKTPQAGIVTRPPPLLFPASKAPSKPLLKVPPLRADSAGPVRSESNDQPPDMNLTAPAPAEEKPRQPHTTRIFVWGAVLIIIAVTVRYFVTYEAEPVATVSPAKKAGQLFHKIVPVPPPTASGPPADQSAPTPPAASPPQAVPPPKAPASAAKAIDRVKAYVPEAYPYTIHMASFQSSALARETIAHYRRGFQAYLVHVNLGKKGIWHRIYFGHFPSATAAMDAIKKYHLDGALVSRSRYACLFGSYPSAARAGAASRQLTGKGFFPYTIVAGDAYHVFVGAHPTRAAAEALSENLSANGFSSDLIER